MADVRAVVQLCDPSLLDPCGDSESDCSEAARMVLHLTDSRRVQKILGRQLFVLDSMMSLLEGLEFAQQLMTQPCPPQPDGGARRRWKVLKAENRSVVEETETLLTSLQDRSQQIQDRRHTLTQLVQQLDSKKQQSKQLEESLQKAQNALQSCDHQLTQLKAESEVVLGQLMIWQRIRDELQAYVSAAQDVMQISLLSFNQSELCVELRPRPSSHLSSNDLEPLRLSVTWSHDDRFTLQVTEGPAGLVEDGVSGRRSALSAALLEVMQCYVGQSELLSEIQRLRSSFAIDWRPSQRVLVYLKSALLVCELEVDEGYPSRGAARLLSVRRDGQPLDTSGLKPYKSVLSLTDWLVFLSSSPLI
ncbi:hypothetical protein PFLUV_G00184670 [Perca fluviatilis]|uniref:Uncharacterized protein n=2 Tax=Perca fluviatilis TaxID=8168 RepID=A0A6A5EPA7_PERFL|nr:uncharacterized protein si:dkey-225f5.4 isoform X1 [Perca fluviatilis]KAF1380229.1 hypothetical protein PFLUV_G00184670 [Perca fluviatilis]